MKMPDNQRRVQDSVSQDENVGIPDDVVILESDETSWILVGEIWVDVSRIVTVGPMYTQGANDGDPVVRSEGVTVQLDVPHDDAKFVHEEGISVAEVMGRILDATTADDEEDDE